MSVDFTNVKEISIPEGNVKKIEHDGVTLWELLSGITLNETATYYYVVSKKSSSSFYTLTNTSQPTTEKITVNGTDIYYTKIIKTRSTSTVSFRVYTASVSLNEAKDLFIQFGLREIEGYNGTLNVTIQFQTSLGPTLEAIHNPNAYTLRYSNGILTSVSGPSLLSISLSDDFTSIATIQNISL